MLYRFLCKEYSKECQNFAEIAEDLATLSISRISQFNVKTTINESSAGRLAFYMNESDIFADLLQNAEKCTTYFNNDLQKFIVIETSTHFYAIIYLIS